MFKLAIEVCFENHFGLIHAIFLTLGSTKSGYFFLRHPVDILSKGWDGSRENPALPGWKTIDELITSESKTLNFKTLNTTGSTMPS